MLTACEHRLGYGRQLLGAHAEVVRVPRADVMLAALPDTVTDVQAILATDSLPGPFSGLQQAALTAGESVVVLGCGPVGLCTVLLARYLGAEPVIAVDHHQYRLAAARAFGAEAVHFENEDVAALVQQRTAGRGADLVIEVVGRPPAMIQAVDLVRPRGRILSLGDGLQGNVEFPLGPLLRKHATLIPSGIPPIRNHFEAVLGLLEQGAIDPSPVVTHILPLTEVALAYEMMANRKDGALKIALQP